MKPFHINCVLAVLFTLLAIFFYLTREFGVALLSLCWGVALALVGWLEGNGAAA